VGDDSFNIPRVSFHASGPGLGVAWDLGSKRQQLSNSAQTKELSLVRKRAAHVKRVLVLFPCRCFPDLHVFLV
jgi:hypothetical protein